jgi:hypothetical protein
MSRHRLAPRYPDGSCDIITVLYGLGLYDLPPLVDSRLDLLLFLQVVVVVAAAVVLLEERGSTATGSSASSMAEDDDSLPQPREPFRAEILGLGCNGKLSRGSEGTYNGLSHNISRNLSQA